MRALIADTDAGRCAAVRRELERQGHEVTIAEGVDGVLAAVGDVTLAVLGDDVGGASALEACRALRDDPRASELLVVVTATEGGVAVPTAIAAGADDVWLLDAPAEGEPPGVAPAIHYARLLAEHVRVGGELALLRQALELTDTGFLLTDPRLEDNPIVYVNRAFSDITGWEAAEVLGRNPRMLQGVGTNPATVARMREAVREERPVTVQLLNRRKDGTPFRNEVHLAPVHDEHGDVVRFVGVQVDTTAHRLQQTIYALEQEARQHAEAAESRSAFLADASPLLDASLDLRATLDSVARVSVPRLGDLCLVNVVEGGEVRRVAFAAREPAAERLLRTLPRTYRIRTEGDDPVARVLRLRRAEVLRGAAADVFGDLGGAFGAQAATSAMLVPLVARGRAIGVLAVGTGDPTREMDDDDLALAEDLGRRAALALDNARLFEQQRGVAATLQESLLPDHLPQIDGVEFGAAFRPAGDGTQIGGDFYDAFPAADGALTLAIGDVSGKGARAAALTGLSRHTLRTAAMYEQAPSRILATLNRALVAQRNHRGKYCTAALCRLRPHDGVVGVDVACAGHPLPLVLRRDGTVETVGRSGTLLGYVDDPDLHDEHAELRPGDAIVLYTDGISEARTREGILGDERLAGLVRACAGLPAPAIAERLEYAARRAAVGPPRDDVAIAVARAL